MSDKEMDSLIIRHLLDLENAAARLHNDLGTRVFERIDNIVQQWIATRVDKWFFKASSDSAYARFAPESWRVAGSAKKESDYKSFFQFKNWEEEQTEFYLTPVCNLRGGPFGVEWQFKYNESGMNRNAWRKFIQPEIPKFMSLGFRYQEKNDLFFVQTSLSQEKLAVAIENDAIEDALDPVRQGLKTIEAALEEFDRLIHRANSKQQ